MKTHSIWILLLFILLLPTTLFGQGTDDPYSGELIILFDERTQCQAEYTCMGLEQFPNATKIGSTTAGGDGNIAYVYVPGNIKIMVTFLGVYYPDYTPTQRVGIIPDYEIKPTIAGIRAGKDEVLEFALHLGLESSKENEYFNNTKIFPNPAQDSIKVGENFTFLPLSPSSGHKGTNPLPLILIAL